MSQKYPNMKSTVNTQGEVVTQIIHFVGGIKRTYHGILTSSIKQGQFTKFKCTDGSMVMINDDNVLCIEVFSEENIK
jgi:hypothetical protein